MFEIHIKASGLILVSDCFFICFRSFGETCNSQQQHRFSNLNLQKKFNFSINRSHTSDFKQVFQAVAGHHALHAITHESRLEKMKLNWIFLVHCSNPSYFSMILFKARNEMFINMKITLKCICEVRC